ncbi:hypothetical protein V3C99_006200, partial [Haemonchus contortus]
RHEIWICFIIIPIVITLIILAYCLLRRVLLRRKKKVSNHVSLRFPLPPPTGEYDDMDETQYDVRVPALRETKSKESKEEGIGSTDIEADSREEQVPTIATMMREERREEPKLSDSNGKKK